MNVYLLHTPEYSIEEVCAVQGLLSTVSGPINFHVADHDFDTDLFPFLNKYQDSFRFPNFESDVKKLLYDPNRQAPLSWRELFSLCHHYRETTNIDQQDFVVLLTRRRNALNWFCHGDDHRNIFVHTGDWEYYTKAPHEYPVAYSLVETILQRLMKIDVTQWPNPNIHFEPIGCMNDFCQNKTQIIFKLRTGDICNTCLEKLEQEGVDDAIINQAIGIFEHIRTRLLFHQGFRRNQKSMRVIINADGEIKIGDKTLDLSPIESTLFIFFATQNEGVALNNLASH